MARDRNTFIKRQRETGKKQKAEEKRARRRKKKESAGSDEVAGPVGGSANEQEPGPAAGA